MVPIYNRTHFLLLYIVGSDKLKIEYFEYFPT